MLNSQSFAMWVTSQNKTNRRDSHGRGIGWTISGPQTLVGWLSAAPQGQLWTKIRVVGKGSCGTAALYRKRDDDSLVILKEIDMHGLSPLERSGSQKYPGIPGQL
eukprot:m.418750 g.418750  ORF g.418750 m.418750 type:complete len:105 (+) comp20184_c0_seq58:1747-2061(+)